MHRLLLSAMALVLFSIAALVLITLEYSVLQQATGGICLGCGFITSLYAVEAWVE